MTLEDALQRALAAEHRAVYLYEYAGGRATSYVGQGLAARMYAVWRDHQGLRSWLESEISARGKQPVAADLVYPAANVTTKRQVRAMAREAEHACLLGWLAVVSASDAGSKVRDKALSAYVDIGLRDVSFGGAPQPLPGLKPAPIGAASVSPSPSSS